ncbi:hypothetical protein E7Z59_14880 [Robertkochia marina]|uniref:Cardiolipin synthase N-terminal domain-containing protein n=1 Tax=Robertkochia marina TaxID=1227945 RepID=A0A4S3LXR2_9FLAO|nr:hypothetical protein [Robertkochia marina]THD65862.1 hypothetical protein E7Z59_14880 [Robertkochia marina]TRZ41365.1 hypothetical protein D3A96_13490 [Robertkochia marina]
MKYFLPTLLLSLLLTLLASVMKVLHWAGAPLVLDLAFVLLIVYTILGLSDLWRNKNIKTSEKLLWTLSFLVFLWFSGLLYYKKEYKKAV